MPNPNSRFNDPRHIVITNHNIGSSTGDGWLYVSKVHGKVIDITFICSTISSEATARMDVKVVRAGTAAAPSSGTSMLSAAVDLSATSTYENVATAPSIALSTTDSNLVIAPGDKIGRDMTNTPTALVGGLLQITIEPR